MNESFLENEEIEMLLKKYFDAVYNADIDALKDIFHKQAGMCGYLMEDLVIGTPTIFFNDLASQPSMNINKNDCRYIIKEIEVIGKIAKATLFVNGFYGSATIKDMFHLIKEKNKWKIIQKTFTTVNRSI